MKNLAYCFALLLFSCFSLSEVYAQFEQPVTLPDVSQKSRVMQTVGLSKITVDYSSPAVKNRKIWGELVPFDKVWRAGANANTVITFTDDVKIDGKYLPAGTFGLHMIPNTEEWTIIFSQNSTSWGSYFYEEGEDVLRIKVKPQTIANQEWLSYGFEDREEKSTTLVMQWEKVKIALKFEVDVPKIVVENLRQELRSLSNWSWVGTCQAATYCAQNEVNQEEALTWIERSISMDKNFTNLIVKSRLLTQLKKEDEAKKLEEEAYTLATDQELGNYAYQLGTAENQSEKAMDVAEKRAELFPKSWRSISGLAQAYQKAGNAMKALKYFKSALKLANGNEKATQWIQSQITGLMKK